MALVDASLVQQVFDILKRERETNVQHHRKADDFGAGFKAFERGRSGQGQKLRKTPAPLKQSSSDKTVTETVVNRPSLVGTEAAHSLRLDPTTQTRTTLPYGISFGMNAVCRGYVETTLVFLTTRVFFRG